jgi:hypothetical protein
MATAITERSGRSARSARSPRTSAPAARRLSDTHLVARTGICVGLAGATLIHGTVVAHHFQQWPVAGLFFIGLELVEIALALAAVYVWGPRVAQAVIITGFATVLVWLVSRTLGMPIGPALFQLPEPVGVPDLACCFLELAAAALAAPTALASRTGLAARTSAAPAGRVAPSGGVALAAVVAAGALVVTAWGLGPAANGTGHGAHQHTTTTR